MNIDQSVVSRRRFLTRSAQGLGGLGLGTAITGGAAGLALGACSSDRDAPAFRYWDHRAKGELTDFQYIAMCGTLAPSAHNTQPWKFHPVDGGIELFADRTRNLGSADAQRRMMLLSLGCAMENMRIGARRLGYRTQVDTSGVDGRFATDGYCGILRLQAGGERSHPFFDAIFTRQTTRGEFLPVQPPALLRQLLAEQTADLPGIGLRWLTLGADSERLLPIVHASVRDFLSDQRHRDGMKWFRITREEWETRRDGIAVFNSDAPFFAKQYVEWFSTPADVVGAQFKQGEIDAVDRVSSATPLWGLVHADRSSPAARIAGGRLAERVYLAATQHGHGVQPICYPTEIPEHAASLSALAGLPAGAEPLFLFRIGRSDLVARSVRRDLKDVLV